MAYMLDYDLEDMLGVLSSVVKEYAEGSKERDATELAQIALYYIYSSRKQDDFNEFYKRCFDPSLPKIEIAHEFATREDADKWLASGNGKDSERVKIAGKGFMVNRVPSGRLVFMIAPLPEELNSPEWQGDPEDDSE